MFGLLDRDAAAFRDALGEWRRAAEVEAPRIITALDANIERIATLRRRPRGSLCFWGVPGAGKTQLAAEARAKMLGLRRQQVGFAS